MRSLTPNDAACLAALPADVRQEVRLWITRLESLTPPVTAALKELAKSCGVSFATARRKYDAWSKQGWEGLVNRSKAREGEAGLPDGLILHWQRLCVENQRKCKPAYRKLVRDFFAGATIPGVAEGTPRNELPPGWSYENLMRHKPTAYQLKAIRIGKATASDLGPMVYTTRAGLAVGEMYLFDDIVHDHFVNVLDTAKTGRPVEFHALDLKSACKVHWGIAARTESDITGRMESLREEHMRFLLASLLSSHGYRPVGGTTLIVEHGTAAIREDLERILHDLTGGLIRVARSGIQGDPAFVGQYAGRGKGNFRFKGALESLGNLIHNEMADVLQLPGQTGRNTDERPEGTHGLLRHNDALLNALTAIAETRPDVAQMLRYPLVSLTQFREIAEQIYARINCRTDHRLEGWDAMCVPADGGLSIRRMSPAEVWTSGRRTLTPLPPEGIAQILYRDSASEVRITPRHEIEMMEKGVSADALRFRAEEFAPGEKYQAVLNPFAPSHLFLFDARGRYVGSVPRILRPSRNDQEAVARQLGRASHDLAERLRPVAVLGARITAQRVEETQANAAALDLLSAEDRAADKLAARAARAGAGIVRPERAEAPVAVEEFSPTETPAETETPVQEI
jgi:hypothetical protein